MVSGDGPFAYIDLPISRNTLRRWTVAGIKAAQTLIARNSDGPELIGLLIGAIGEVGLVDPQQVIFRLRETSSLSDEDKAKLGNWDLQALERGRRKRCALIISSEGSVSESWFKTEESGAVVARFEEIEPLNPSVGIQLMSLLKFDVVMLDVTSGASINSLTRFDRFLDLCSESTFAGYITKDASSLSAISAQKKFAVSAAVNPKSLDEMFQALSARPKPPPSP